MKRKQIILVIALSVIFISSSLIGYWLNHYHGIDKRHLSYQYGAYIKNLLTEGKRQKVKELPRYNQLSFERHQMFYYYHRLMGANHHQAVELAINSQLLWVAILDKATELGLEISDDEIKLRMEDYLMIYRTGYNLKGDEIVGLDEFRDIARHTARGLGLKDEAYFTIFIAPELEAMVAMDQLLAYYQPNRSDQSWDEIRTNMIEAYRERHRVTLEDFIQQTTPIEIDTANVRVPYPVHVN